MEPLTHRCGSWTITLIQLHDVTLPWCVGVTKEGDLFEAVRMRGFDPRHALRCAAEYVGANPDDWFKEFEL